MKKLTITLLLSVVCLPVFSEEKDGSHYIGYGVGGSFVEPRIPTDNKRLEVEENTDAATRVYTGYVGERGMGVELEYINMGQATLNDPGSSVGGDIDYSFIGVAGTYQVPFGGATQGYGKLGVGKLKNESHGNVSYRQVNEHQVYYGVGVRHFFSPDYAMAVELSQYDEDAASMTVNFETHWKNKDIMTKDLKDMLQAPHPMATKPRKPESMLKLPEQKPDSPKGVAEKTSKSQKTSK